MVREIRISDELRRKAVAEGTECVTWVADLPRLVREVATLWDLRIGESLDGGTASFVAAGTTVDGTEVVLKLAMPAEIDGWDTLDREARVLQEVHGRGCVRILDYDPDRHALLIERLGSRLADLGFPPSHQLEIICGLLRQVWAVVPVTELPSGFERAAWLGSFISDTWEHLDRPASVTVIDHAGRLADKLCHSDAGHRSVLVHGDAHAWNTLQQPGANGEFRLIDPDGLCAEPEYDLSISMREYLDGLLDGDPVERGVQRAHLLAELTGTDAERIWDWGYLELVSNGLLLIKTGKNASAGRASLGIAERWAQA